MDEYTIVEVTETPIQNPGDGLPRETTAPSFEQDEYGIQEEIDETNGPWEELDALKRHKKMLELGYKSDITIKVQDKNFRCHQNIIGSSSPKLAKMIRNNPSTLQLQNIAPNHFQLLLEIIYVGKADKFDHVDEILCVARTSHELQVYSAVAYCSQILRKMVDATSVCQVLDFALQISDNDLKEACIKVIREQTDAVLKRDSFINCNVATLEVILSQEVVQAVTELDLFLACARWAETRRNPRQALGSALSLIRFRVLTAKDFAKKVVPSKLLTAEEEKNLTLFFLTGEGEMPEGFSNKENERQLFVDRTKMVERIQKEVFLGYNKLSVKFVSSEEINACPPLRFSVNTDINLLVVNVWSIREGKNIGDKYIENCIVTLKDKNAKLIASATFCEEVERRRLFTVRFSNPVPINANNIYALHYINLLPSEPHWTAEHVQKTYKLKNGAELRVLENAFSPIWTIVVET